MTIVKQPFNNFLLFVLKTLTCNLLSHSKDFKTTV